MQKLQRAQTRAESTNLRVLSEFRNFNTTAIAGSRSQLSIVILSE